MSALLEAADAYLKLRRSLGHDLAEAHRLLPHFVAYLDATGASTVTIEAALAWTQPPDCDPASGGCPWRMAVARGFARHMAGIDPRTEVPPAGLIPRRRCWRAPFLYSPADVAALMAGARSIRARLAAATHETVIGLLAVTGMRLGEALRLDRGDVDWTEGVLAIRESKFRKSRRVPVLASTLAALEAYAGVRDLLCVHPATPSFFVSLRGTRPNYVVVDQVFRRLCDGAGVGAWSAIRPRVHDLRHTFAVTTGLQAGVDTAVIALWLGHADLRSTNVYLHADMTINNALWS